MPNPKLTAIQRCGYAIALSSRALLSLRCGQVDGFNGQGLADALCDMMLSGDYPLGWPVAEAIRLLDRVGVERCARTAALRRRLATLQDMIVALHDVLDDAA